MHHSKKPMRKKKSALEILTALVSNAEKAELLTNRELAAELKLKVWTTMSMTEEPAALVAEAIDRLEKQS